MSSIELQPSQSHSLQLRDPPNVKNGSVRGKREVAHLPLCLGAWVLAVMDEKLLLCELISKKDNLFDTANSTLSPKNCLFAYNFTETN